MTPKEKAKELVEKIWEVSPEYNQYLDNEPFYDTAQKQAIIAVDELLGVFCYVISEDCEDSKRWDYWKEVKDEISLL